MLKKLEKRQLKHFKAYYINNDSTRTIKQENDHKSMLADEEHKIEIQNK